MSPQASSSKAALMRKSDDDVVIVSAIRTAMTKAKKGGFKDTRPEELLAAVLAHVASVLPDKALIEDVVVGNVLPPAGGASGARMAALHAGIPNTSSVSTVNRQCSSGLTAIGIIANAISAGTIDAGIGAGVESMSFGYGASSQPDGWSEAVLETQESADCLIPMGITSENVAKDYGVSRAAQDKFAATSFQRAAKAQKDGKFKAEIVPVKVKITDPKTEKVHEIVVEADDGIRDGVTAESLGKLKPAFSKDGCTHAGNASQISDGAAAVLLMRRSVAKKLNLPILGKYVSTAVVGVPPRIMGVGPAYAIPRVLEVVSKKLGQKVTTDDIDFFEINEAFASQAVFSVDKLGLDYAKVNINGGAIALGHPLGCTGARQIATGLNIAKQTGGKVFVTSMCIGSGMGMAGIFVSEQ